MKKTHISKLVIVSSLIICTLLLFTAIVPALTQAQGRDETPPGRDEGAGDSGAGAGAGAGNKDGGSNGDGGGVFGEIRGVVTDLTTGQPAGGVEVSVNGMVIRTDAVGKYQITGLGPDTYSVVLNLLQAGTPAQGPQVVNLPAGGLAIVDLQFFTGGASPAPVPAPVVPVPVASAPEPVVSVPAAPGAESPPELPDAGAIFPDADLPVAGPPLALAADAHLILPLSDAQNILTSAMSRAIPAVLCNSVYVVQGGDALAKIADFFLGDSRAYPRIMEATNISRVEDSSFTEIAQPNLIRPGHQLCIPSQ